MIDAGTKCKIAAECGLARGNLQVLGIIGLVSKPKLSWFIFFVDLKVQSAKKTWAIVAASIRKKNTFCLLTGFNPSAIKNMAQGSVFRGHYSNKFDCNDPQVLALALLYFTSPTFWNHYIKRLASF
jgi:hypothetical protein